MPSLMSTATRRSMLCWRRALAPDRGRDAATDHKLFGVIVAVAMHRSVTMRLKRDDVDLDTGVLMVRLTKLGKSLLAPLHLCRVTLARLPQALRHPNAARLASRRRERRAAASTALYQPRSRLRTPHLLVPLGLPGVDRRSGAASRSAIGGGAMSHLYVATSIPNSMFRPQMR
jgi:integrase